MVTKKYLLNAEPQDIFKKSPVHTFLYKITAFTW
jgi:hypothetical protein